VLLILTSLWEKKIYLQIYLEPLLYSLIFTLCLVRILSQYNQNYTEGQNNLLADCIVYCKGLNVKTRSSHKPMKTHRKLCFLSHSTKGLKMDCQLQIWWKETSVNTACLRRPNRLPQNFICPLIYGLDPLIGAMYMSVNIRLRSVNWCHVYVFFLLALHNPLWVCILQPSSGL
jgi:hypothetical protein